MRRDFSGGIGGADDEPISSQFFTNKYKYESEIKSVLAKLERALELITEANPSDPRKDRMAQDLAQLRS